MSHFDNKYYKSAENPKKLIVFIHGYNGSPEAIDYAIQWLMPKLEEAVIVLPRAPNKCEKDVDNLQWLSFFKEDPEIRFRNPEASVEEIYDIFRRLGDDFARVATEMNQFIDEQQKLWNIDDEHTYLCGFSQGAMLTIYTALTRKQELAGCVSVAGLVPDFVNLKNKIISRPPFLLLHGSDDATVQYKTLPTTLAWFEEQGLNFEHQEFEALAHRMSEEEMEVLALFIRKHV